MNLGFTLQPPAPPRVLATAGEPTCGKRFGKTQCHRPEGHPGGHLSANGEYLQAEESVTA